MLSLWPFWLYVAGLPVVFGAVGLWAWQTREISPAYAGQPPGAWQSFREYAGSYLPRRPETPLRAARRSARAGQARAWMRYVTAMLRRVWVWAGIQVRKLSKMS